MNWFLVKECNHTRGGDPVAPVTGAREGNLTPGKDDQEVGKLSLSFPRVCACDSANDETFFQGCYLLEWKRASERKDGFEKVMIANESRRSGDKSLKGCASLFLFDSNAAAATPAFLLLRLLLRRKL